MPNTLETGAVIRDIEEISEMRAVEGLQKEVWRCADRDILPALALIPSVEVGGILVGAFDGGELVGFAYGFVGLEGGRPIIHSDMLAVKPAYRGRGLGYRLKLAQRERALARGVSTMTWTFDPLQSRNAHLNFAKLGVVAQHYKVNFYGEETSSFLHQQTGTDRLWVCWPLTSERVRKRLERGPGSHIAGVPGGVTRLVSAGAGGAPQMSDRYESEASGQLLIEIPRDIMAMQQQNPVMALTWRDATRRAFVGALAAGFVVEEFYHLTAGGRGGGAYLLLRRPGVAEARRAP
jgi:predicted GNAT superfamily acetyltransferase